MRGIPAIVELEKGLVPILIKRSEISKTFTKESREFQSINAQVEMIREEIRIEINKALETEAIELASMKIKIDALKEKINHLKNKAYLFSQQEKMHKDLQRQIKLYQDSYILYSKKTESSRILEQKQEREIANIIVSSKPSLPINPVYPNKPVMLVFAFSFGLFMMISTPFIIETIDSRIKSIDDVEVILKVAVVCTFIEKNSPTVTKSNLNIASTFSIRKLSELFRYYSRKLTNKKQV